jgi:hypothetical protein
MGGLAHDDQINAIRRASRIVGNQFFLANGHYKSLSPIRVLDYLHEARRYGRDSVRGRRGNAQGEGKVWVWVPIDGKNFALLAGQNARKCPGDGCFSGSTLSGCCDLHFLNSPYPVKIHISFPLTLP